MPNASNVTSPVLIVGAGRSGSSWIVHVLGQHPSVQPIIENRLVETFYLEVFQSWWAREWHWVCTSDELRARAVRLARTMLCELFPSDRPVWVMKALWRGRPWDFLDEVFPDARYIHALRSPVTAIPSMMEHIGTTEPAWRSMEYSEYEYTQASREALAACALGRPWLGVRQEDVAASPEAVWSRLAAFVGVPDHPVDLHERVNVAESTWAAGGGERHPIAWSALSLETRRVAEEMGYADPDAPARTVEALNERCAALEAELRELRQERTRLRGFVERVSGVLERGTHDGNGSAHPVGQ